MLRKIREIRPGQLIIAIAVCLAVAGVIWSMRQISRTPRPAGPTEAQLRAKEEQARKDRNIEIEGATIEQRDASGNLLWTIKARGKLTVDDQGRAATGENVHWELRRANQQMLTLDATRFTGDYATGRLTFTGGVSVVTDGGKTAFSAPSVVFEFGTRKLIADGGAELRRAPYQCTAQRLVFDDTASEVRLSQGVQASDDVRGMKFTGKTITVRLDQERLTGSEGVQFRKGPYTASAAQLQVDNKTQRLRMSGKVRLAFRQ